VAIQDRLAIHSLALELSVNVGDVAIASVGVPERRVFPSAVSLLAAGLKRIAVHADVLAGLDVRTIRGAVRPVSIASILAVSVLAVAVAVPIPVSSIAATVVAIIRVIAAKIAVVILNF
jgi:hypothetical protein